jgi:hypothetical protein
MKGNEVGALRKKCEQPKSFVCTGFKFTIFLFRGWLSYMYKISTIVLRCKCNQMQVNENTSL